MRYEDLNERSYEHNWDVKARLYEGTRIVDYQNITNLVGVVEKIYREGIDTNDQQEDGGQRA